MAERPKPAGTQANDTQPNPTQNKDARTVGETTSAAAPLETAANPEGKTDVSTGNVGDAEVIVGQEHVLGDDPRRNAHHSGYHDSLTGRPINEQGHFTDTATTGSEGPVPAHRIVADNWPQEREAINDPAKREGNTAV
jgi:hypothetical protein